MRRFLAIDGGGTKTTAVLVDEHASEIVRLTTTTSNPSVIGLEAASTLLEDLARRVLDEAGVPAPIDRIWAGLSGFGRADDHVALRAALGPLASELTLTNDIELILGALPNRVGIAAIAGTGSIVAGRNTAREFVRVGGWGHIFGDEGSGYFYGVEALRAVAATVDGSGPDTGLRPRIFAELKIDNPFDLIPRVYNTMDKAAIAALSRHTMDAAFRGDAVSVAIVERGAEAIAHMIRTAAGRLALTGHLPLALTGGVYLHNQITRDALRQRLEPDWESIDISLVIDPATTAARALAHPSWSLA